MSYKTAPTSPNPYITRKLNNMDEAKAIKKERKDWTRIYHKMLKEIEAMIYVQRRVKDMMKIAKEANTTIAEMEGAILEANINNQVTNAINIAEVLEDLRYLVQSNMENWVFQIQRMLADELDAYKRKKQICEQQYSRNTRFIQGRRSKRKRRKSRRRKSNFNQAL